MGIYEWMKKQITFNGEHKAVFRGLQRNLPSQKKSVEISINS